MSGRSKSKAQQDEQHQEQPPVFEVRARSFRLEVRGGRRFLTHGLAVVVGLSAQHLPVVASMLR